MLFYLFLQKWTAPLLLNLFLYERPAVPRPYGWGFKAVRKTFLPHQEQQVARKGLLALCRILIFFFFVFFLELIYQLLYFFCVGARFN